MGHFGFSYVGLLFLAMVMIPNLIWTKYQPIGYDPSTENKVLLGLERVGEVAVSCCVLIFSDFNLRPWANESWWLVLAIGLMLLYEIWWIRYFHSAKTLADFYSSLFGIPLAGATLPVAAVFLLGVYGNVIWLMLSSIILGLGHIGIHYQHAKELQEKSKQNII